MKKLAQVLMFGFFLGLLAWSASRADTAPQEQASELAVPTEARPALKTVVTVIQCNTVIGVLGIDETGEVHAGHFTSKADVQAIQKAVPADHNIGLNVGCPGKPAKDTTVL